MVPVIQIKESQWIVNTEEMMQRLLITVCWFVLCALGQAQVMPHQSENVKQMNPVSADAASPGEDPIESRAVLAEANPELFSTKLNRYESLGELFSQNQDHSDSSFLVSDRKLGYIRIGDSIGKYSLQHIHTRRYIGDGYRIYEKTYQMPDSCVVTAGFNYYMNDTSTISYLSTDCSQFYLASGVRVGTSIQEMLALDKDIHFEIGYGPEFFFSKGFENSYVRLWTNAVYDEEKLLNMKWRELAEIQWEGSVVAIELLKWNVED